MSISTVHIIIVDKNASLKSVAVKDFQISELYKKCGFKKPDDFKKQTEWKTKVDGKQYFVSVYAKEEGRANGENKYDFPPPIDTKLFFGSCAIVAEEKEKEEDGKKIWAPLTVELWEKIYEKLFGGFDDLKMTILEDEEEEDELANVPASKKTKQGYLKDGFVVDSDSQEDDDEDDYGSEDEEEDDEEDVKDESDDEEDEKALLEELGSELSEEEYEDETSSSESV